MKDDGIQCHLSQGFSVFEGWQRMNLNYQAFDVERESHTPTRDHIAYG